MSAGGIGSPHLLMLSGVGPADHLREFNIAVVHDLAGVIKDGLLETGVTPVLKTVGHAAWDLAAARVALQMIG